MSQIDHISRDYGPLNIPRRTSPIDSLTSTIPPTRNLEGGHPIERPASGYQRHQFAGCLTPQRSSTLYFPFCRSTTHPFRPNGLLVAADGEWLGFQMAGPG
jgi:hypothetical protein